jgi:hypothetical protein
LILAQQGFAGPAVYFPVSLRPLRLDGEIYFNPREAGMSIVSEFREFAVKGNMVDMAVASSSVRRSARW